MSWATIRGHDDVVQRMEHAWRRERLAHAYLFVGPHGIGKWHFAREFAKALLCEAKNDHLQACDVCNSCRQVMAGSHPDLIYAQRTDDSLDVKIEVVRELCDHLSLKPARAGRKVAILNDADDLTEASANCFLKTLEEPPPMSVLILIGSGAERQLMTILSRCQVIRFAPLPSAVLAEVLAEHGITDPERQRRAIQLAGGSVSQAIAFDDDELWQFRATLADDLDQKPFPAYAVGRRWMSFIESAGKESSAQRGRASLIVRMVIEYFQLALRSVTIAPDPDDDNEDLQRARQYANRVGVPKLLEWLERALEADMHIDRKVQLVLAIEAFLDALTR